MKKKSLVRKELKNNSEQRKRSGWKREYKKGLKYTSSEKVPVGEKWKKKIWLDEQVDHSSQDQNLYCAGILATLPKFLCSFSLLPTSINANHTFPLKRFFESFYFTPLVIKNMYTKIHVCSLLQWSAINPSSLYTCPYQGKWYIFICIPRND